MNTLETAITARSIDRAAQIVRTALQIKCTTCGDLILSERADAWRFMSRDERAHWLARWLTLETFLAADTAGHVQLSLVG